MPTSSSYGIGPQDHAFIGKAAELPGKAINQYISVAPIVITSPGRPVELNVRITFPPTGTKLPIILLSHGHGPSNNLSSLNGYLPLSQYYASHGFAVIQPTHLTSRSLNLPEDVVGGTALFTSRVEDMTTILDHLDIIERSAPTLTGRLDRSRVAVYGHSMGSHTASMLLGMTMSDPDLIEMADPRISAGILMGAIGGGDTLTEAVYEKYSSFRHSDFSNMTVPTLVVSGDEDNSAHLTTKGPAWHEDPYYLSGGEKDLLRLAGGRHSFGGVSGWDNSDCVESNEESPKMVAVTQRMSVAWLKERFGMDAGIWEEAKTAFEKVGTLGQIEHHS